MVTITLPKPKKDEPKIYWSVKEAEENSLPRTKITFLNDVAPIIGLDLEVSNNEFADCLYDGKPSRVVIATAPIQYELPDDWNHMYEWGFVLSAEDREKSESLGDDSYILVWITFPENCEVFPGIYSHKKMGTWLLSVRKLKLLVMNKRTYCVRENDQNAFIINVNDLICLSFNGCGQTMIDPVSGLMLTAKSFDMMAQAEKRR